MRVPGLVPGLSQMAPRMLAETGQEQQARTAALRRVLQQRQQQQQQRRQRDANTAGQVTRQVGAPLATAGLTAAGVPAPVAGVAGGAAATILGELVGALG